MTSTDRMILHWSPRSPFVRKVMIAAHELGLAGRIDCVRTVVGGTTANRELMRQNPLGKLRLTGLALERLKTFANGTVAYTQIYLSDFAETDSLPADTEDLINYPRSVEGVEVAMVFIEQVDRAVKVSFRSRSKIDVDKVAEGFEGGGHRLASGATISGTMDEVRAKVLDAVQLALR